MKPRVLVTREISAEAIARLKQHFLVVANQKDDPVSARQLLHKLKGIDGAVTLTTDTIGDELLAKNPQLKIVSNVAVGYNNFDVAAATRRGVMMTNTPGAVDDATADLTWALILAAARGVTFADKAVRAGRWKRWRMMEYLGQDIYGKTIGIIGFGRIGRGVARRAMGFNMKVLYASRSRASDGVEQEFRASYVDKQTLLRESDVVTLHLPLFPETRHYIGAADLALMKKTAILVNASRGPVVDEKALVRALKARRIFAAGLDVYEHEPALSPGLAQLANVVLTPHIGSGTYETRLKMSNMAVTNCIAGLTGERPPNLLNPEVFRTA
ncbi:MAG TPA: D-glycerate dehydrogenase [Vicinamibacterales bacterium]|nr:D-glycerate dehydrogenase [Vicinamibacterales bacterium]